MVGSAFLAVHNPTHLFLVPGYSLIHAGGGKKQQVEAGGEQEGAAEAAAAVAAASAVAAVSCSKLSFVS